MDEATLGNGEATLRVLENLRAGRSCGDCWYGNPRFYGRRPRPGVCGHFAGKRIACIEWVLDDEP